jgi:hypothetical protein
MSQKACKILADISETVANRINQLMAAGVFLGSRKPFEGDNLHCLQVDTLNGKKNLIKSYI